MFVSTDDEKIAEIAKFYGAEVPFLRPKELSGDHTDIGPVIDHLLDWLEKKGSCPDYLCLLLATAPFVRAQSIQESYQRLLETPKKFSCVSVTEFVFPIQRAIKISPAGDVAMFQPEHFTSRSQDLEKAYHDAGQFSWQKIDAPELDTPGWGAHTLPYILPGHEVQDIDTPQDWIRAEIMYKVQQLQQQDIE